MKTIAVISFTDLNSDPRVNRQIRFLCQDYQVIALGMRSPGIAGVEFVPLSSYPRLPFFPRKWNKLLRRVSWMLLLTRSFDTYYWAQLFHRQVLGSLAGIRADLIIANDLPSLPLALKGTNGGRVILDAHEYAPREWEERFVFRLLYQPYYEYLCRQYIPRTQGMITVCQGIADQYEADTGVKPVVMTNAPDYEDIEPRLLADHERIRLVHHGIALRTRRIESMIRMMDLLDDRFHLSLLLVDRDPPYLQEIKALAERHPRVEILPPVPMRGLARYLSRFDVGVYILEPSSFNNLHALPNKFFDFIQARLAVAIAPSPEMARIVRDYDLGVVAEEYSPESLAERLRGLDTQEINRLKQQAHRSARALSADRNREILLDLVRKSLQP